MNMFCIFIRILNAFSLKKGAIFVQNFTLSY